MLWHELWDEEHEPSDDQIEEYVGSPLWANLAHHLQQTYKVKPKLFYSGCAMDKGTWKGWNVKYKKNGRALCTLYPKQGYFIALINIGPKEAVEADLLISACDAYTQALYYQTQAGASGKSLAIPVTNDSILHDVRELAALRAGAHFTTIRRPNSQ